MTSLVARIESPLLGIRLAKRTWWRIVFGSSSHAYMGTKRSGCGCELAFSNFSNFSLEAMMLCSVRQVRGPWSAALARRSDTLANHLAAALHDAALAPPTSACSFP